jgi:hypothetical protein
MYVETDETIAEITDRISEEFGVWKSPNSKSNLQYVINKLGLIPCRKFKIKKLNMFIEKMIDENTKIAAMMQRIYTLNTILKHSVNFGVITKNPFKFVLTKYVLNFLKKSNNEKLIINLEKYLKCKKKEMEKTKYKKTTNKIINIK